VLHEDARPLYDGLSSGAGLVAGLVSGIAGVATLALVYLPLGILWPPSQSKEKP